MDINFYFFDFTLFDMVWYNVILEILCHIRYFFLKMPEHTYLEEVPFP